MWYKLKRIMMRPNGVEKQVRPSGYTLSYDFTTSSAWWDANGCPRNSSWFYRNSTRSDGAIFWPSEIFNDTPKKIIITYGKSGASSGTWIWESTTRSNTIWLPRNYNELSSMEFQAWGVVTSVSVWWNPTWDVTREMNIDSSTTNRTVTHKITWLSDVTDNYWIIKQIRQDQTFIIRIVNWYGSTGSIYIRSATFEY
jgi:hypothetical protein